jgi:hypothetical protein
MQITSFFIAMLFVSTTLTGQNVDTTEFENLRQSTSWNLDFEDNATDDWQSHWFLDGVRADITHSQEGMIFSAGPVAGDDACHAVLWTKDTFQGDIKIEYEYTRTDTQTKFVNILYIQASGKGMEPYAEDISAWNELRVIPSMRLYFEHMNALHISYAAFENDNESPDQDYIRVRRYPVVSDFGSTEVPPESLETGLFVPGETYKITAIKTDQMLYFKVEGKDTSALFSWDISNVPILEEGRVGLRHMYTRSARYKNFRIYTRK